MNRHESAIVFPGQGVQRPGMGEDFYNQFAVSRAVFEEASEAVGLDLATLCFAEDPRLTRTEYAQPAILVTEIAMFRAVCETLALQPADMVFGGHSLGEYSALVAAGALPLADAVGIVRERGRLMQEAAPLGTGGMLAVIGRRLDRAGILESLGGLPVCMANDNSCDQLVLAGLLEHLSAATERLMTDSNQFGIARCVPLDVSAPFHSRLMLPAEQRFSTYLGEKLEGLQSSPCTRVTSNFSGAFHNGEKNQVHEHLARQISGTVQWRANMDVLTAATDRFLEIGPGRPLRGFFSTLGIDVTSITSARALQRTARQQEACA